MLPGREGLPLPEGDAHGGEGLTMSNELTVVKPGEMAYAPPSPALVPANIPEGLTLAKMLSDSSLVPQHLRGKVADCFLIVEQSMRWGLSPFAVAQATSLISGKLMFEGKLVAAVINAKADLAERLRFDYSGEGEARKVTVRGTFRGEKEPRDVEVTLREARTNNEMWRRQPDQQLAYHGARVWARRHAPEVMLGIYAPEEMGPVAPPPEAPPAPKAPTTTAQVASGSASSTSGGSQSAPAAGSETATVAADSEPDDSEGNVTDEDINVRVPIFEWDERSESWQHVKDEPKVSPGQLAKIHALCRKLGHQLDRVITNPQTKKKETQKEGKLKQKLVETFGKESRGQLSTREAGRTIDWLEAMDEKLMKKLDTWQQGPLPKVPGGPPVPATPGPENREDLGPLMDLTSQLIANGHKTTEAQLAWVNLQLSELGQPAVMSPALLTAAQVDRLLGMAQGET
jgi:hypothetical protein